MSNINTLETNLPQFVAQKQAAPLDYIALVPWGHIRFILDKGYSAEKLLPQTKENEKQPSSLLRDIN